MLNNSSDPLLHVTAPSEAAPRPCRPRAVGTTQGPEVQPQRGHGGPTEHPGHRGTGERKMLNRFAATHCKIRQRDIVLGQIILWASCVHNLSKSMALLSRENNPTPALPTQ